MEQPIRLVYCGPNISGGRLLKFSVFKGGHPEHLEDVFEKCPAIKELFVPVAELNATIAKTQIKGTEEARLYNEVVLFLEAKGV